MTLLESEYENGSIEFTTNTLCNLIDILRQERNSWMINAKEWEEESKKLNEKLRATEPSHS